MNRHTLQLVALSAVWGSTFMLTRFAVPFLGPNLLAAARMGMAALALTAIMQALRLHWPLAHWRELALLALIGVAAPHALFSWSALHLPAGYAALLYVSSVLFGAIASVWFKQEDLTAPKVAGCLLGIAGAALLVRFGPLSPTPELVTAVMIATLGSALSGVSTPMLKRAVARMDPMAISAGMHVIAFLMLLPGAVVDWPRAQVTPAALAAVFVMGALISGLGWWLYARILRHVTPLAALSSTFMITGFGVLWAVLFLGERLDAGSWLGGALLLLSSLLVMGYDPRRQLSALDGRKSTP